MTAFAKEVVQMVHYRLTGAGFDLAFVGESALRAYLQLQFGGRQQLVTNATIDQLKEFFPTAIVLSDRVLLPVSDGQRIFATAELPSHFTEIFSAPDGHYGDVASRFELNVERLVTTIEGTAIADPTNVLGTIERKTVSCARSDPRLILERNPPVAFRAARLAMEIGGTLDPFLYVVLRNAPRALVVQPFAEAIGREVALAMDSPKRAKILASMSNLHILQAVLPSIGGLSFVEQSLKNHGSGGALLHALLAVERLQESGAKAPSLELSFATLFHDVGKIGTALRESSHRLIHPDHELAGAHLLVRDLTPLGFAAAFIDKIVNLVFAHMQFFAPSRRPEEGVVLWLAHLDKSTFETHYRLHLADATGREKPRPIPPKHRNPIVQRWETNHDPDSQVEPMIVTPAMILRILGESLTKNEVAAKILIAARQAELSGIIQNEAEAIAWIRERYVSGTTEREGVA